MAASPTTDRLLGDLLHLSNVIGPRPAGTRADDRALALLEERFESLGLRCSIETFRFIRSEIEDWSLHVDGTAVPCVPLVSSPSTDGPVSAQVANIGYGTDDEIRDVQGKIVLGKIGKVHESIKAEKAAKKGAVGALFFAEEERWGIYTGRMQYPVGSIPGLCISARDGLRLGKAVPRGARVSISVKSATLDAVGKNLIAETGSSAREYLTVTAHRDSRPHSPGANDNGSGCITMLEAARNIAKKKSGLGRRVVFISPDAEEYGLRGSTEYVKVHADELKDCVGNVNLDSTGQGRIHVLEKDRSGALSPALNSLVTSVARAKGIRVGKMISPNGSDCDPFMAAGVDACWIRGWPNISFNSTTDTFEKVDYGVVRRMATITTDMVLRMTDPNRWKRP